jgi:hypothetical protein
MRFSPMDRCPQWVAPRTGHMQGTIRGNFGVGIDTLAVLLVNGARFYRRRRDIGRPNLTFGILTASTARAGSNTSL